MLAIKSINCSINATRHPSRTCKLEAVRSLLREPLFRDFLGFTPGVRGNAANLKPPAALLAAGFDQSSLEELLFALKRLDDFCLSNRVIIFNEEV